MKQRLPDQDIEIYQRQLDIAARADANGGTATLEQLH